MARRTAFPMATTSQRAVVIRLGLAQTLGWASSYYLPALLAAPMARELGLPTAWVFAAFSLALVVSAWAGPLAGGLIDRHGGRPVLMGTSGLFALGLLGMSQAQGLTSLLLAWALVGVAMGAGLYEAAFATVVRLYGQGARHAITGITLMGGLASTVGWPLTAWLEHHVGWRGACAAWALLHGALGLPLHVGLPRAAASVEGAEAVSQDPAAEATEATGVTGALPRAPAPSPAWTSFLLAVVFAITWFISTAMAAHLPAMLQAAGASVAASVAVGALVGPAQVAGRLLEYSLPRRVHPLWPERLAALAHPLGAATLLLAGPVAAPLFALLHGAGNGILTIAKGTLPLVLFGPAGYGARQGWLMLPARVTQALAPFAFGLVLDHLQEQALWFTAGLGLLCCAALLALRTRPR